MPASVYLALASTLRSYTNNHPKMNKLELKKRISRWTSKRIRHYETSGTGATVSGGACRKGVGVATANRRRVTCSPRVCGVHVRGGEHSSRSMTRATHRVSHQVLHATTAV
ncbi:hypothetical protein TRVL_09497 [Trypanosoma vivax]|nr:hypothetical protein TRVL_09497 [Trypanosoma vivax]